MKMHASGAALAAALLLAACGADVPETYPGYVEGRYLYLSPTASGRIERIDAVEGGQVAAGSLLLSLEAARERAEVAAAQAAVEAARAEYDDRSKGQRDEEIAVTRSQRRQAQADLAFAESEYRRLEQLLQKDAISRSQFEAQRAARDAARARVAELDAALRVAALASRDDALRAAAAQVQQAESQLAQAQWRLSERELRAPEAALVHRVYRRGGELASSGEPVLALLPPANRVLRFWVPEALQSQLSAGSRLRVHCAACGAAGLPATVAMVSPDYEFTPPVLYTERRREKLRFMVEARLEPADALRLNPGLPVEVAPEAGA